MTRRDLLKGLSIAAAGAVVPARARGDVFQAGTGVRYPLGLQVGRPNANLDQAAVELEAVRKIGYELVEFSGLNGQPPEALRKRCEELGLRLRSIHLGSDQITPFMTPRAGGPGPRAGGPPAGGAAPPAGARARGANLGPIQGALDAIYSPAAVLQMARVCLPQVRDLGCEWGVISAAGISNFTSVDALKRFADALNKGNELGKGLGVKLSFHSHDIEFAPPVEGRVPFEVFLENTDPSVRYQLDIGWAAVAGGNVVSLIERHAPRLFSLHLRDLTNDGYVAGAGEGVLNWPAIHAATGTIQNPLCYVEGGDRAKCFQNLQRFGWGQAPPA